MQTWTFRGWEMTIRDLLLILPVLAMTACTSVYEDDAQGQVVYHWERPRTGVIKFSRDHSECLRAAENWSWTPDINSWFYSEEAKLDIRADWHAERGIWATYVPYPGAQPLIVNSLRDDENIKPKAYRECMENRGYAHRFTDIPETTNLYIYRPQRALQGKPFNRGDI